MGGVWDHLRQLGKRLLDSILAPTKRVFEKTQLHFRKRQIQVQGKWKVVYVEGEIMKLQLIFGPRQELI